MKLVFQCRVTQAEAVVLKREPGQMEHLKILMAVSLEAAQRISDKPFVGEIVVDDTNEIIGTVP